MISAVVLAAGRSTRMKRQKALLPVEGKPMLERVLATLRRTNVDEVVVVLGAGAAQVRRGVGFGAERVVVNRRYAEGMSSSLRLGLRTVSPSADAAIIAMGDQPFLSPKTVDTIVERYLTMRPPIVVPTHGGARGNPVLLARVTFPDVMKVRGDVGARSVVRMYGGKVLEVPVHDEGVLFDVDTPADYRRAAMKPWSATGTRGRGGASPRPVPPHRSV